MAKRGFLWVAAAVLTVVAWAQVQPDYAAQAREACGRLAKALMAELTSALQEGGPSQAVSVCKDRAPAIAAEVSQLCGVHVRRTALRVRNPENAPDAWETSVLKDFQHRIGKGEDPSGVERSETVDEAGKKVFRYMKAIPTGEPCLTCHGSDLDPALRVKIQAFYPKDEATGFQKGELRGAFTVRKVL
jgi:hypothetical protein